MQEDDRRDRIAGLINQYKAGDEEAFVELYMETKDDMERFCRYRFSRLDDEQVKDVLQISFIRIVNNLEGFMKPEKFMTWAFEIVKNTGLNYIRDEKKYTQFRSDEEDKTNVLSRVADESQDSDPYQNAYIAEVRALILEGLADMDKSMRETFSLFYFDHLKMGEIAEVQSIKIGTVKSRLHNARKKLREKLKKEFDEGL